MSIKRFNDKDIFENVIDIGLRMYGNGSSYPKLILDFINEYCRQQIRLYFIKHNQFLKNNNRITYLDTLVYTFRHNKNSLKRLQQFVQAKDRPSTAQQEELIDNIRKDKKVTTYDRFNRICHRLQIHMDNDDDQSSPSLDDQRSRQYKRLDAYYKSDKLTPNDYLQFVEQQHISFNNLRSLSSIDINHWLHLNHLHFENQYLRLAEICVFIIKEILLNLMDNVYISTKPCQINDILRRRHVYQYRRLPYSGRKRKICSYV